MKLILIIISIVLLGVAGFLYFKSDQKKEKAQGTYIYYYPKANVYFDKEEDTYYLIVNDKWERSKTLTEEQKLFLGKNVLVKNAAVPVWKENEHHRLVYGTALYTTADEYKRKYYEDSISSLPKKAVVVQSPIDSVEITKEAKKQSGVRKFFDKLFKKKKSSKKSTKN